MLGGCFDDAEKMLFNELVCAFDTSIALRDRVGDDLPLTIRANFGTVLIASMFGAAAEQIGDNPPWIRHGGARWGSSVTSTGNQRRAPCSIVSPKSSRRRTAPP